MFVAAPAGVDRDMVIDAAQQLLVERGRFSDVSLREIAERLGVRTQSLYAHVDGVEGLRYALALRGQAELAGELALVAVGRARGEALAAIVRCYYKFAVERPGLYEASLRPPGDDPALLAATAAVTRPLNIVLESYGLSPAEVVHWYRIVFAGVHGFAVLQQNGMLTLPGDPSESIELMISAFVHQIERESITPGPPSG
jgi:AcrR family transcriptional regulator